MKANETKTITVTGVAVIIEKMPLGGGYGPEQRYYYWIPTTEDSGYAWTMAQAKLYAAADIRTAPTNTAGAA